MSRNKCILAIYNRTDNDNIAATPVIINSPEGQPYTPVYVGWPKYNNKSRVFGAVAKNVAKRNLDKTFMMIPTLIGLDKEHDDI